MKPGLLETLPRLLALLRPHRHRVAWTLTCSVIGCVGGLLFPLAIKASLGEIIAHRRMALAPEIWLAIVVALVTMTAIGYISSILFFQLGQQAAALLRTQCLEHLLAVPLLVQRRQQGGDLLDRFTASVADIEWFVRYNMPELIFCVVFVIGGTGLIFWMSWKLSLVLMLLAAGAGLVLALVSARIRQSDRASAAAHGQLVALLQELLLGMDVVQSFNAQQLELDRFQRHQNQLGATQSRAVRYAALLVPLVFVLSVVAVVVVLLCSGQWLATGELKTETLVAFLFYVMMLAGQGRTLSLQMMRWQQLARAFQRIDELLALPRESDTAHAQPLPGTVRGAVAFDSVAYRYPDREQAVDGVSFDVAHGQCVGIVGESGAGKTTLFQLLLRFAQPQSGTIAVDGIELQQITTSSLRAAIAVVPQDSYLFNDTILENVRYGRPLATGEDVRAACRDAQAEEFVTALPQGYQTIVGERGLHLSAGQRQRLAIARALLKNAPILLLDESTSALDASTERQLRAAMDTAMRGRTTLVIAHRLATVIHLPQLLVMHRGRLLDTGSHAELLARCPVYANLVATQLLGLPPAEPTQ